MEGHSVHSCVTVARKALNAAVIAADIQISDESTTNSKGYVVVTKDYATHANNDDPIVNLISKHYIWVTGWCGACESVSDSYFMYGQWPKYC